MVASKKKREERKIRYANTKETADRFDRSSFEPASYTIPEGMKRFKWKKGRNRLDFIPFVAKEGNPDVQAGLIHYFRKYFVHDKIGPEEKSYCCLARTFNKRCPVCEELAKQRRAGKTDEDLKTWKIKDRIMFYVRDLDEPDQYQLLESGIYKSFGELLKDEIDLLDENAPELDFWHLKDGWTLEVICKEDTFNGRTYNKPIKITFRPRKKQYGTSLLKELPSLDDVPTEVSYKELKDLFLMEGGEDDSDTDEEEEPVAKKSKKKRVEDEDDDLGFDEESDEEEEEEEDEEEEPKSKKKGNKTKKKGNKTKKVEEDDDDLEDEDSEDEGDEGEEEDDESDDDDDESDDDESEDDDEADEEESEDEIEVGDTVSYEYKGKERTGEVTKINKKNGVALVKLPKKERPAAVDLEDLTKVEPEEEEEEEEAPKNRGKKSKVEEDEDDILFDEDEEDDSDEDDEPVRTSKRR
jgi:hypothetical protein